MANRVQGDPGYEAEARLGRYIGEKQWLYPYIGMDWTYRKGESGNATCSARLPGRTANWTARWERGTRCPLLLVADARIDTDGKVRLQLERDDIPLTSRLRLGFP